MPRVPAYTETVGINGTSAPQFNTNIPNPLAGVGEGLISLGRGAMQVTKDYLDQNAEKYNAAQIMSADQQLNTYTNDQLFNPQGGALTKKGKNAIGILPNYMQQFDDQAKKIGESLTTDVQRTAFEKAAQSRRQSFETTLMRHQFDENNAYQTKQSAASLGQAMDNASLFYNDPARVQTEVDSALRVVDADAILQGLPPETVKQNRLKAESGVRLSAIQRLADTDPIAAQKMFDDHRTSYTAEDAVKIDNMLRPAMRKYKASGVAGTVLASTSLPQSQNDMISYVIDKFEDDGKGSTVQDGKGQARYGINTAANPDVNPADLTKEKAIELYKSRYWDAAGIGNLPQDMQLIAFDTAVNHGVAKAQELIKASGNDPRKLLELRKAEYDRLVKENPAEYKKNEASWNNRLSQLSAGIDRLRGELPPLSDLLAEADKISPDPDVAQDARALIKDRYEAAQKDIKQSETAASNEAWSYVNQGLQVPASVEARMNPEEVAKMRSSNNVTDPVVYAGLRQQIVTGQLRDAADLSKYRWQLGGKYDELLQLMQDPAKQVNARKVDDIIEGAYFTILGKKAPKDDTDYAKVDKFRRAVQADIEQLQTATQRVATGDDMQKIVDRQLLVTHSGWFSDDRVYQLKPGDKVQIEGIDRAKIANPANGQSVDAGYQIGGKVLSYDEMVAELLNSASSNGQQLTNETLAQAYRTGIATGIIKVVPYVNNR